VNYENVLYTHCEKCVFHVDEKCYVGQPCSDKKVVGLCRSRIMKDANKPQETQTPESLAEFVKEKLKGESSSINVVVWFNGDIDQLSKTVNYMTEENHEKVGTVIVVVPQKFGELSKDIGEICKTLKKWTVFKHLEEGDKADDIMVLFEDNKNLGRGWYLFLEAGDEPCFDCITTRFLGLILGSPHNPFALVHPTHNDRYLIHSLAFLSLGETNWLANVAKFDNFENCVLPLLNTSIKIGRAS
jgi:hypothetical protein